MHFKSLAIGVCVGALAAPAWADITALVAVEPTARKEGLMLSRTSLESSLGKLLGQKVAVTVTDDLTDAMRATRSGGYDVFIAPPQVAASAMAHGYELVGSTDAEEQFVLVGRSDLKAVGDLRQGRIYLPQQDSIYTYVARGMLTAGGLSFKDLRKVEYARFPQAGLTALTMHVTDVTIVRRSDWEAWQPENHGSAKVLSTQGNVPGGFSVTLKKELPADTRSQLAGWFATSAPSVGMRAVVQHAENGHYQKIAELGTFTPTQLPGATLVTVEDVKRLVSQGAIVVDTRNEQEYKAKHIPGAKFAPYIEKSLKDVAYDAKLDDFSAIKTLNPDTPTVFQCNGPECWKSYKASRAAIAAGFKKVYWYRGGMPDWERSGQTIAHD